MAKRRLAWADFLYSDESVASGSGAVDNLLASGVEESDTITIACIVMGVQLHITAATETELTAIVDVGIGVASVEAFNIGLTALPDPNTAGDYPPRGWLYVGRYLVQQSLPTGGTPTAMWRVMPRIDLDLRTMRKVDKGRLFIIWRNTDVLGTQAIKLTGRVRTLCMT